MSSFTFTASLARLLGHTSGKSGLQTMRTVSRTRTTAGNSKCVREPSRQESSVNTDADETMKPTHPTDKSSSDTRPLEHQLAPIDCEFHIVDYPDAPNHCTISRRGQSRDEAVTEWISADGDSFVDAGEML